MSEFDPTLSQESATPTPDPTPVPATQGTPAPQVATPPAPQPVATTGEPGEAMVPSWRLREVSEQTRALKAQFEAQQQEFAAREEAWNSKVRALMGVDAPPDPKVDQIRQGFAQVFPGLSKLSDEQVINKLLQLVERSGDLESAVDWQYEQYAQQKMTQLFSMAEKDLGGALSAEAKQQLHAGLIGYIQSSPQAYEAYVRDPNFITNYWKAFTSGFIDPVRRVGQATAQERAGVPIPSNPQGGAPSLAPAAKPANIDERIAGGWAAYNSTKR